MSYNFLQSAIVTNSMRCLFDSTDGYTTDFKENGNVDGYDVYYNIHSYGCWEGLLFGTSLGNYCYIGRHSSFIPVQAENYYLVKLMLRVVNNNKSKVIQGLTKGRLQWVTSANHTWDSIKQVDFDIIADDGWHLYVINMGPISNWVGSITNIRVYPFIDGNEGDQFFFKFIRISSKNHYMCSNTNCDYYLNYEPSCPGSGRRGFICSNNRKQLYTTIKGENSILEVDIDGYGLTKFDLGTNKNVPGYQMAKIISRELSQVSIGGYSYNTVIHDESFNIKIISGTFGEDSTVHIIYSKAAEALGFYNSDKQPTFLASAGTKQATGFDYAASRLLTTLEINRLSDYKDNAYEHKPNQYMVTAGREDFDQLTDDYDNNNLISYTTINNKGMTIIDFSHPVDNNGKIDTIRVFGKKQINPTILLFRFKEGSLKLIKSIPLEEESPDYLYSRNTNIVHKVECNIVVNKGDIFGFYDIDLYAGKTAFGGPDATYIQLTGKGEHGVKDFSPIAYGIAGFAFFAKSSRLQKRTLLAIDFINRTNFTDLFIKGRELHDYFEYNIASCLDISWDVDLHEETHKHEVFHKYCDGVCMIVYHDNKAFNIHCLDDGITTSDNGLAGTSYTQTSNGLITGGGGNYFYVNGDNEWVARDADGDRYLDLSSTDREFTGLYFTTTDSLEYHEDPITFTLKFPNKSKNKVTKSIMYFKESNNFRAFTLFAYMGEKFINGNYINENYLKVPKYTLVKVDNKEHIEDLSEPFLYANPTDGNFALEGSGLEEMSVAVRNMALSRKKAMYRATLTKWTILEHNFEPIECEAFCIRVDLHYSTKVNEIEVYSRIPIIKSLVDNVSIRYSTYGDVWTDLIMSRDASKSDTIFGKLGGSPRYLEVDISSDTEFILDEFSIFVGDHVKTMNCEESFLLTDSSNLEVNNSMPLSIQNTYTKAFDLRVDIPRNTTINKGLIFYSKLNSKIDLISPTVGAPPILYKAADRNLINHTKNCCINTEFYGLNDLVEGAHVYIVKYVEDVLDLGVMSKGLDINYKSDSKLRLVNINLTNPVSSKHWRLIGASNITSEIFKVRFKFLNVEEPVQNAVYGTLSNSTNIDVELVNSAPIDYIQLFSTEDLDKIEIHVSNNGVNYYYYDLVTVTNTVYNDYFILDLNQRHVLDIVRNYGEGLDKIRIGVDLNVEYSDSEVDNISEVNWDYGDKSNARWLRVPMECGNNVNQYIRKIGVYPDITAPYVQGGGFNTSWTPLGNDLSSFEVSNNAILDATVVSGTYCNDFIPNNALNGVYWDYHMRDCWGFFEQDNDNDILLEVELEEVTLISSIELYFSYDPTDTSYIIGEYTILTASTPQAEFSTIINVINNTKQDIIHELDTPIEVSKFKIIINAFDSPLTNLINELTGEYYSEKIGLIRCIKLMSYVDKHYLDSEHWPIIAVNLKDASNIVHYEVSKDLPKSIPDSSIGWSVASEFVFRSDSTTSEPEKVSFKQASLDTAVYFSFGITPDLTAISSYLVGKGVYLDSGLYNLSWTTYNNTFIGDTALVFDGPDIFSIKATLVVVSNWSTQTTTLNVKTEGVYNIKVEQFNQTVESKVWYVKDIKISRSSENTKWVALIRDTATDYAYNDDPDIKSISYISSLKLFTKDYFNIWEKPWWWFSSSSELSTNHMIVKESKYSLQIDYKGGFSVDNIYTRNSVYFGTDKHWEFTDYLSFWVYIHDITLLDQSKLEVVFGNKSNKPYFYYQWDYTYFNLNSGWNKVKLPFYNATNTYPSYSPSLYKKDSSIDYTYIDKSLSIRTGNANLFEIHIAGRGDNFSINITDIKIERSLFDITAGRGNTGLTLTNDDFLELPVSDINVRRGAVSFWLKTYYDSIGRDYLDLTRSRQLFSVINNSNNVVSLSIKEGSWFSVAVGHTREYLYVFDTDSSGALYNYFSNNSTIHVGLSWDHNGENLPGKDTIQLFIDGNLVARSKSTWKVDNTKYTSVRLCGGGVQASLTAGSSGGGIFNELKLFDHPILEFNPYSDYEEEITTDPGKFIEISKDDLNFHGIGSSELPLLFKEVPPGNVTTIFIRSNKLTNFNRSNKLTADLQIEWAASV